jgi:hypothetical protein
MTTFANCCRMTYRAGQLFLLLSYLAPSLGLAIGRGKFRYSLHINVTFTKSNVRNVSFLELEIVS